MANPYIGEHRPPSHPSPPAGLGETRGKGLCGSCGCSAGQEDFKAQYTRAPLVLGLVSNSFWDPWHILAGSLHPKLPSGDNDELHCTTTFLLGCLGLVGNLELLSKRWGLAFGGRASAAPFVALWLFSWAKPLSCLLLSLPVWQGGGCSPAAWGECCEMRWAP